MGISFRVFDRETQTIRPPSRLGNKRLARVQSDDIARGSDEPCQPHRLQTGTTSVVQDGHARLDPASFYGGFLQRLDSRQRVELVEYLEVGSQHVGVVHILEDLYVDP